MSAPVKKCEVTPLEALQRLCDVARKVDASEAGDFETLLQGELAVAEAVLRAPDHDEELLKVKSDVEGLMGYGFMVDNRRVGLDRIVWFNRPGEQSLHARPLPDNDEAIQYEFNEWIGPRRSGESPQEAAVLYWAQEAYRAGRLAAPVVPVAAQPVVQQEPVAWLVYAEDNNGMVPQFPAYQVKQEALRYAATFGQTRTEIWPIYAAPSLEAQPAGEVVIMPQRLTPRMKQVLKEVAPKWNAESIYANLYDAAAMAQGEKQ